MAFHRSVGSAPGRSLSSYASAPTGWGRAALQSLSLSLSSTGGAAGGGGPRRCSRANAGPPTGLQGKGDLAALRTLARLSQPLATSPPLPAATHTHTNTHMHTHTLRGAGQTLSQIFIVFGQSTAPPYISTHSGVPQGDEGTRARARHPAGPALCPSPPYTGQERRCCPITDWLCLVSSGGWQQTTPWSCVNVNLLRSLTTQGGAAWDRCAAGVGYPTCDEWVR